MKVCERMILEYVASDGKVFQEPKLCKEYEIYLKADKVYLVEVLGKALKGVLGTYPTVLFVCATEDIAKVKVDKLDRSLYQYINIIERVVEG